MTTIEDWMDAVLHDFERTPAATAGVQIVTFDPARPDELADLIPGVTTWAAPDTPLACRLLLVVGKNGTSLDESAGEPAATAVEAASHLQDFVIDELHRPWPEVVAADGGSTVLEPWLSPDGAPVWVGRGVVCEFGALGRSLAFGPER